MTNRLACCTILCLVITVPSVHKQRHPGHRPRTPQQIAPGRVGVFRIGHHVAAMLVSVKDSRTAIRWSVSRHGRALEAASSCSATSCHGHPPVASGGRSVKRSLTMAGVDRQLAWFDIATLRSERQQFTLRGRESKVCPFARDGTALNKHLHSVETRLHDRDPSGQVTAWAVTHLSR
jgi:hypothetical protein